MESGFIRVHDINGRIVREINLTAGNLYQLIPMDVNDLDMAVYILNIQIGQNASSQRFVKI